MNKSINMKVYYIDGTEQSFEWEVDDSQDRFSIVSSLKKSINEQYILIKTEEGELIIINKANVKHLKINAAPDKMPPEAIINAREL